MRVRRPAGIGQEGLSNEDNRRRGIRRGSIRVRVTVATSAIVAVTLFATGVTLVLLLQQLLVKGLDDAQLTRAADVATRLQTQPPSTVILKMAADSVLVQIIDPSGTVIASSSNVAGESPVLASPPAQRQTAKLTVTGSPVENGADNGSDYRVVAAPVTLSTGPGWIYVGASLAQVDAATSQLTVLFLIGLPIVVVIIAAITWLAVRQSLRPVENIRRRAAAITAADLSQRVPVPTGHDEIALLAETMNNMLTRIEHAAVRQRQFVGDASHELRSPLAALQVQVDVALLQAEDAEAEVELLEMRDQVTRMAMLIDDLLFLASTTESAPMVVPSWVDLDELVFAEAERLRALGGPSVTASVLRAARVHGSYRDLTRMLRNLGDNAHDHAAASVQLVLTADDRGALITVTDDGKGIDPNDRELIFARFSRLDNSRVRDSRGGGTGLGLSIAQQIAQSLGGTIVVRDRADGASGAEFVVRLPLDARENESPPESSDG